MTRTKNTKYVDRIGVEIECGVDEERFENISGMRMWEDTSDGSINYGGAINNNYELVEFRTIDGMTHKQIKDALDILYKKTHLKGNDSTGMHVHISVKPEYTDLLMSGHFALWFQHKLRLDKQSAGKLARWDNEYCEPHKSLRAANDEAIKTDDSYRERYRTVNFEAFQEHGTFEFRSWKTPHTAREAKRIVKFCVTNVEKYCDMYTKLWEKEMKR